MSDVLILIAIGALGVATFFGACFLMAAGRYSSVNRLLFSGAAVTGVVGGFAWHFHRSSEVGAAMVSAVFYGALALLFVGAIWFTNELQIRVLTRRERKAQTTQDK